MVSLKHCILTHAPTSLQERHGLRASTLSTNCTYKLWGTSKLHSDRYEKDARGLGEGGGSRIVQKILSARTPPKWYRLRSYSELFPVNSPRSSCDDVTGPIWKKGNFHWQYL